eukprot:g1186.t1
MKQVVVNGSKGRGFHKRSMATMMKNIVCDTFGAPSVMMLREDSSIREPKEGELLVDIHAAGVNPSDTYVRLGPDGPYAGNKKLIPSLPYTPGKDGSGVVAAVGPGVSSGIKTGDRVYVSGSVTGTYAQSAICTQHQVYPLPGNVSFEEGACVGVPCATAYRAIFTRGAASKGDAIFIHGASGAVGLAAVQLAVSAGCYVVGSAGTSAGEDAIRKAGAHGVVNHRVESYLQEAGEMAGDGFDLLVEMAADVNLVSDMGLMNRNGRIAIVGSKAAGISLNPRLIMPKELDVRGVFLGSATLEELRETHTSLYEKLESGQLKPVVGACFDLREAPEAHVEVMEPSAGGSVGNVVIRCA